MAKVVIFALLSLAIAQTPDAPAWPDTWTSDFEEERQIFFLEWLGNGHNTGTWYYDWKTERQRIDRSNGRFDTLCGANGLKLFQNTPCSQIIVDGNRYLYYPDKNECCHCCDTKATGCGMIKPTWMSGAEFMGEVSYNNQTVYKWNVVGGDNNYIYETIASDPLDRTMLRLN